MKSERVSLWLSLLANFGVLVGLALLIVEIRHNTLATQAAVYQESMGFARDHVELLIGDENEDLATVVFRGEKDPSSLAPEELEKFLLFVAWRMSTWETSFLNYDEGLLDERMWGSLDSWYSSLLQRGPGYRTWWERTRHGYDRSFQAHVDRAFDQLQ